MACNGGEYCACKRLKDAKVDYLLEILALARKRPNIYSNPLPPYPTIEEIKKAVRDELKKAGVI